MTSDANIDPRTYETGVEYKSKTMSTTTMALQGAAHFTLPGARQMCVAFLPKRFSNSSVRLFHRALSNLDGGVLASYRRTAEEMLTLGQGQCWNRDVFD